MVKLSAPNTKCGENEVPRMVLVHGSSALKVIVEMMKSFTMFVDRSVPNWKLGANAVHIMLEDSCKLIVSAKLELFVLRSSIPNVNCGANPRMQYICRWIISARLEKLSECRPWNARGLQIELQCRTELWSEWKSYNVGCV